MPKPKTPTTSDGSPDRSQLPYRRCVGIMLINRTGNVFVGRRADVTQDAWQMPQGGIDRGESARAAALRELAEEVGTDDARIVGEYDGWLNYDLPTELMGKAWKGRYRGQTQRWFAMHFLGRDEDIRLDAHHPEFVEWRWEDVDRLPALTVDFKRDVYRSVVAAFSHLARPW